MFDGADLLPVNFLVIILQVTSLPEESTLLSDDLHLLESFEFKQRIKHISEIIEGLKWDTIDPDSVTRYSLYCMLFL